MREIKFRAWDEKDSKMVFDFINNDKGVVSLNGIGQLVKSTWYHLMQYTGLKDKNGKEIYEGDIVLANGSESVLIHDFSEARKFVSTNISDERKFEKRRSAYKVYWQDNFSKFSFMSLSSPKHSIESDVAKRDLEVVGNLFENPDLTQ